MPVRIIGMIGVTPPSSNASLHVIEGGLSPEANRILSAMSGKKGWSRQEQAVGPVDNAGERLMRFALESDVH